MTKKRSSKSGAANYRKLLEHIENQDLGGGTHFIAKEGKNTVRIMPALDEEGFFFEAARTHYHGKSSFLCPNVATEGKLDCPCCDVNELLYQAGDKDAASDFRGSKKFYMNIINRDDEDGGPKIYACPTTVFSAICAVIADPDYGNITDWEEGTDIVIHRTGKKLETTYQVTAKRNSSVLGTEEQMDEWFEKATDAAEYIEGKLLSYDDMAGKTGAAAYLYEDEEEYEEDEPAKEKPAARRKPALEYEDDDEEEAEEEETASSRIQRKLARRQGAKAKRPDRSRRSRR